MGNCIYCTQPAGIFKKYHTKCLEKFNIGKREVINVICDAVSENMDYTTLEKRIDEISSRSFITGNLKNELLIKGWETAVEKAFDDGILTEQEGSEFIGFIDHYGFDQQILDKNGCYSKVVKGAVLRDIMNGEIPERVTLSSPLPLNFQKDERLIWIFQNVDYF